MPALLAAPSPVITPLPQSVAQAVWRAADLGVQPVGLRTVSTGYKALDELLPGRGWPCGGITELLMPQYGFGEWRLLLPALARLVGPKRPLMVISPPHVPYAAGMRRYGVFERQLVLVRAGTPAQRLWATEQAVAVDGLAAVLAWLPQARADQLRRLQAAAAAAAGPVFVIRPEAARHESSPAPLRVMVHGCGVDGGLVVQVVKRRGPPHDGWQRLDAAPPGLLPLLHPLQARRQRLAGADRLRPPVQESASAVLDGAAASVAHALPR